VEYLSIFYIFGDNTDKILLISIGVILILSFLPSALIMYRLEGEEKEKFKNERKK